MVTSVSLASTFGAGDVSVCVVVVSVTVVCVNVLVVVVVVVPKQLMYGGPHSAATQILPVFEVYPVSSSGKVSPSLPTVKLVAPSK